MQTKVNTNEVQFWKLDESGEDFLALQAESLKQTLEVEADSNTGPSLWHELGDPVTVDQIREVPDARSQDDPRTPTLWLKFGHPRIGKLVVATGYLDYESGAWSALIRPDCDAGHWESIHPFAWAYIVPGEAPPEWEGSVIQRREGGI